MTVALRMWLGGLAGARIDDVGVVMAGNVEAAAIAAAGGDRAIAHQEALDGRAVLGVGARVGKVHGLGPGSADHEIAADVENGGGDAGHLERGIDGAVHDVALHEGIQGKRRIAQVSGGPRGGVQLPVRLPDGCDGAVQFLPARRAALLRGELPGAAHRFGSGVERSAGALAPGVEGAKHVEQFGRDGNSLAAGAEPAAELAVRVPGTEDGAFAGDLAERGALGARSGVGRGREHLHLERGAQDVLLLKGMQPVAADRRSAGER